MHSKNALKRNLSMQNRIQIFLCVMYTQNNYTKNAYKSLSNYSTTTFVEAKQLNLLCLIPYSNGIRAIAHRYMLPRQGKSQTSAKSDTNRFRVSKRYTPSIYIYLKKHDKKPAIVHRVATFGFTFSKYYWYVPKIHKKLDNQFRIRKRHDLNINKHIM